MHRPDPPDLVACWAYTADRGWHLSTVSLDAVLQAEFEDLRAQVAHLAAECYRLQAAVEATQEPCGTYAAYARHKRRGEEVDDLCRSAYTQYRRGRRAINQARAQGTGSRA